MPMKLRYPTRSLLLALALSSRAEDALPKPDPSFAADAPPGHSVHGDSFDEGPRRRLPLLPGCGNVSFPVTSSHPEVAAYFNQGVAQLHGFWYWEAERSFRTVLQLDPSCLMGHWGMAMANLENEERARKLIAKVTDDALKPPVARRRLRLRRHRSPRHGRLLHLAQPVPPRHRRIQPPRHRRPRSAGPRKKPTPPGPPLSHPPLGPRTPQTGPDRRRHVRPLSPRRRPHVAHARSHLQRPRTLERRRMATGSRRPRRSRPDDQKPHLPRPDPQLRPQQRMVDPQPKQSRRSPQSPPHRQKHDHHAAHPAVQKGRPRTLTILRRRRQHMAIRPQPSLRNHPPLGTLGRSPRPQGLRLSSQRPRLRRPVETGSVARPRLLRQIRRPQRPPLARQSRRTSGRRRTRTHRSHRRR